MTPVSFLHFFFSFESYSIADDENKYKANYISYVRRKSTWSFHPEGRDTETEVLFVLLKRY